MLLIALIAITSISEDGCAPTTKLIRERTMSVENVLHYVHERDERIRTLQGNGTITIESPEGSTSGSFDARLKKPDSLRVEFGGPFGIRIGTLALSRERFLLYNRMENRAFVGKPDGSILQSMFRLKMRFDEILNAFTGEFPPASPSDSLYRFDVEDYQYVIRYRTAAGTKEYRIDGDAFIVTAYRVLGTDGRASLTGFSSRPDEADAIIMPRLLRVVFPKERRSVTISYDDVEVNGPVECSFTLPKQAEVIFR